MPELGSGVGAAFGNMPRPRNAARPLISPSRASIWMLPQDFLQLLTDGVGIDRRLVERDGSPRRRCRRRLGRQCGRGNQRLGEYDS
ncbi:MAG: hypothetical protein CK533_09980 [Acidobacterium sp.]|nr:MAG: hypothetical protein CK533_09980 [Acidobacterium sp.]